MESLLAVLAILLVASLTPGPNNVMVMAAGARGGLVEARPIIAGVVLGGWMLLALAWAGVARAVEVEPLARVAAMSVGALYLCRMGARMILASFDSGVSKGPHAAIDGRVATWRGVALFQVLNPKAWVLVVSACAAMSREFHGVPGFVALAALYTLRSCVSLALWALAGSALDRRLADGGSRPWLDRALGALLVGSALLLAFAAA